MLVTGAAGFVGQAVIAKLNMDADRYQVTSLTRTSPLSGAIQSSVVYGDICEPLDWNTHALVHVHTVVHCAARVHVVDDRTTDPLAEFRRVNLNGTLNLARQAAQSGVRRFVFVSSIKVNGESTAPGRPFKADDSPAPKDAYGFSKHEAELALRALCSCSSMELVIIRPPLVYGPGVQANFASMMRWLKRGVPLPLGGVDNRRSLVALGNLVDLIATCIHHPAAAGQTFLVSDNEDVSTAQLLRRMGAALGSPARLVSMPPAWIEGCAALLGKRNIAQRLCGSLQVDITKTREILGWLPPLSLDEGLKKATEGMRR